MNRLYRRPAHSTRIQLQHVWLITSFCFKNSRGTKQYERKKEKPVRYHKTSKGFVRFWISNVFYRLTCERLGPRWQCCLGKGTEIRVGEWLDETGYWSGMSVGPIILSPLCSLAAMRWAASATCSQCCDALPSLRLKGMDPTNQGLKL